MANSSEMTFFTNFNNILIMTIEKSWIVRIDICNQFLA